MIAEGELTRVQRMRARRLAAGACTRCGKPNDRAPLTTCVDCASASNRHGRRWRRAHPGYMAAYGKAHRAGDATPSSVGRARSIAAARHPHGASKP